MSLEPTKRLGRDHLVLLGLLGLVAGCNRCRPVQVCDTAATISTSQVEGHWKIEGSGARSGCKDPLLNGEFELGPSALLRIELDRRSNPLPDGGLRDQRAPDLQQSDLRARDQRADTFKPDAKPVVDAAARDARLDAKSSDAIKSPSDAAPAFDALSKLDLGKRDAGVKRDMRRPPTSTGPTIYDINLVGGPTGFTLEGEVTGNCVVFDTTEETPQGTITYHFSGRVLSNRIIEGTFTSRGPGSCSASGDFEVQVR